MTSTSPDSGTPTHGVGAGPGAGATTTITIRPRSVGSHALSHIQQRIWTSQRLAPGVPLANMATVHRIAGALDPGRFATAFELVVRASDALRSVIIDRPGEEAVVRVLADPPGGTELVEMSADRIDEWCRERISTAIDATVCGFDSVLVRHADDDWTWWLDLHHVITDAWSSALVFEAVADVYARLAVGEDPEGALARLVAFREHVEASADRDGRERRHAFWAAVAGDEHHLHHPVTPYGPLGPRTTKVTRRHVDVPELSGAPDMYRSLSAELTSLAVLCTATAVTLHRLDGRAELVLGVPLHHRTGRSAPNVIGPLMELYPLRVDVPAGASFGEVFDRVNRGLLDVLKHARPGESPDAAFDAVVNVLTAGYDEFAGMPASVTWMRSEHVESAHPIRVQAYDYGAGLRVELDLNDGLSIDGAHAAMPRHLEMTLAAMLADRERSVTGFDLVTDDDRKVLAALNPPPAGSGDVRPVHEIIAERLRADPGAVVVEDGAVTLHAHELDRAADALAGRLARGGIGPGARVGLRMPRSIDVLTAVHGVLRAGAAFVMLDPDDPPARHAAIADDAGLALVLDRLPELDPTSPFEPPTVGPDDLAYVLYTSGSTGTPKGVPIPHRGLTDYLTGAADSYATAAPMVMPLHSSLVFDLTITSLFLPQLVGGRTIVFGGDPLSALSAIAADDRINTLKATPSQLELLLRMADGPLGFEVVIVGGEAFRRPLAQSLALRCPPGVRIYNEYGPTEAVVGCMLHRFDPEHDVGPDVPIGLASPGAEVHVLDAARRPTPVGAWGELYVRRPGMATGYLNLPELSAERFAPVAGLGDRPLYRTGDRVRVERDVLVYGGRIDDQLKVNGVRLEPGEIEAALVEHPDITDAVVRIWTPGRSNIRRCVRCGLGTDVPDVTIDDDDVCSTCRAFERVEPQTRSWFHTPDDLDDARVRARARSRGDYDCLHLLSGGKDSTYALYQLHAMGWRIHALTLDNGYISDGAKANIARTVADLGISHEFVTTEAMAEIFRDSLDRYANVCNGCYKTIYTLAVARAHELGIPVIVTGLSRGQFFETRLVPHQFEAGRFDPDAIDRTVLQARRAYHHTSDAVTELLPEQSVFQRDDLDVLDEIEFVDFYRYTDVELADMYEFLAERAPWVRPADTGRSTNCLINVVGIHVHRTERGYHNYAEPYSWDVRLGHKTRDEALDELDDEVDVDEIARILDEIGYEPKRPEVLTAWYRTADGNEIDDRILAAHLRDRLPARSIPSAFVHVTDIPLAGSAKLDVGSLPAPGRRHTGSASYEPPATPTEAICADLWAQVLDVDRVGVDDDFFDLGGASLSALETVVAAERRFGVDLPDALVFDHRRLREFAAAVDAAIDVGAITVEIPPLADGPAPLTPGEEAMLFEHRAAPADPRYHGTRRYRIASTVDPERLRRAFETVVERHQPLHTAFDTERTVLPTARALSFVLVDAGTLDEHAVELARVPFDLAHGPLVRVHVENGPSGTDVLVGLHHITADAGTFDLLWNEIDVAYHGGELPDLRVTAAAHGAWQRERGDGHLPFWREYLERIPTDHAAIPAPPHPDEDGYVEIAAPVSAGELAAASVGTPFAASLAAAAVVLGGYGFDDEVALTVAASTKDHPDVEPLIGYFLNTLPVTVTAAPASTLRDVDRAASAAVSEVLPHRSLQLGEIVGDTRRRGGAVPPLSWMLAYERLAPARFGGSDVGLEVVHAGGAVNDLTFLVYEHGDDLRLAVEHRGSAISSELAHELLTAFARILEALCRRPHLTVDEVRGIGDGNDLVGPALPEHPGTVVDAIVEVASRGPDAAAVVDAAGGVTTYGELVGRARAIASALAEAAPDAQRVGVSVHRSRSVVEAIVGVHLAGAAYVPLDPTMPAERRAAITADAELDAVVADPTTAPWFDGLPVVDPHVAASRPTGGGSPAGLRRAEPDDPAYVVFTSGSTGRPAGVEITHANLAASTAARSEFYGDVPSRFLLTPSIGFDSSMVGLFWPLTTGGTVVVPGDDDVHDVDRLGAVISERDVTHVLMVPSLYRALLGRRAELLGELVTAIVAGEACDAALVAQHHRLLPAATLVNEYGPTEATVWATAHRCANGEDPVPIGRPIAGSRLRVADRHQRPVARGAVGELLISGAGVSRHGYRSGRSNAAFVDDGEHRWYRTGDLVRVDHAGRLLFVGRVDDQLNVGGVRLEPAELESHLLRIPGVDDAVVVAAPLDGRDSIVAHLVGDPDRVSVGVVREQLAEVVAASALPRHVEFHVELPRTSHGKLDRRRASALPIRRGEPRAADAEIDGLVQIWRRALGRPELGPDDDFFASGGDSIAAVEVVTAIGDLIGHDVPVASLLSASTPAAMAARLDLAAPAPRRGAEVRFVTMRRGRPDGPAVVMTAAWDAVHAYRALADRFPDDVTVVAVALEDPNDEPTPLHEVPPFVDAAIEPISDWWRTRSGGPLVVLGWSIGGIVAQHLGEQLARTGIPVTSIALVDTFFPGEDKKLWANRWDKYRRMLRPGRLRAGGREFAHLFKRRLQRYAAALGRRLLRWSGQPVESPAVRKTRAGIPIAALDHEPTPTGVPIVVFAASMTNPNRTYRRWRDVARELRVVPIEGRHRGFESVMGADRVHQIADHLVATDLAAP